MHTAIDNWISLVELTGHGAVGSIGLNNRQFKRYGRVLQWSLESITGMCSKDAL